MLAESYFSNWMSLLEEDMTKKLFKKRFRLDVRKFAFCNRVVDDWNSLSSQYVNCCVANALKKYLTVEHLTGNW